MAVEDPVPALSGTAAHSIGDTLDQPSGTLRNDGSGVTEQIIRQGRYSALKEFALGLKVKRDNDFGTDGSPDERYVESWTLERLEADYGRLTIVVRVRPISTEGGDPEEDDPDPVAEEKWSIKNVQTQLPLSRFVVDGAPSLSAPHIHSIAMWRQEPRQELYDAFQFMAPNGTVYRLDGPSKAVARKYKQGIESVMRFYPVVTRTVTYKHWISEEAIAGLEIGSKLAHIETPEKTFGLSSGKWLCIQDEGDWAADGTFVRVTAWQGCKNLDTDLYGDSGRWEPIS